MPFDRIAKCFRGTLNAINLIETWVEEAGGADQAILHDLKARSAIERNSRAGTAAAQYGAGLRQA
jgi:hypothetical protein